MHAQYRTAPHRILTGSRSLALASALLLAAGCIGPQPDRSIRYYAVDLGAPRAPADAQPAGTLRVRRLSAAGHLHEPMCVRTSTVTYVFLDADRWTEPPLGFVASALDRALFESGTFARAEGGDAVALDVTLRAFELRTSHQPEVVCTLAVQATTPKGAALLDRSFEARITIASSEPQAVAGALGKALELAVDALARALVEAGG